MSDGALLGKKALEQIRQLIRDERARYQNPEGHRARYQQSHVPKVGAVAWGIVVGEVDDTGPGAPRIIRGGEIGLAKVEIAHCTAPEWIGQEVWVGDYLGQILANEDAADRIDRQVIIGLSGRVPAGNETFAYTSGSTTLYTPWILITANCP